MSFLGGLGKFRHFLKRNIVFLRVSKIRSNIFFLLFTLPSTRKAKFLIRFCFFFENIFKFQKGTKELKLKNFVEINISLRMITFKSKHENFLVDLFYFNLKNFN